MPALSAASSQAHKRPLPARWSSRQRCKNTIIYGLIRFAAAALSLVPLPLIGLVSRWLGAVAHRLAPRQRELALRQLQAAIPTMPAWRCRQCVRQMFVHLCQCAFELAHLSAYLRGPRQVVLDVAARQVLDEALALRRGVIVVSGHIGNWELLAQVMAHSGYDVATVAKNTYYPRLTAYIEAIRGMHGLQVIWREAPDGARQMLRVLRRGGLLAMLIDQDTRVEGVWVPFFGRPAYTPSGAAALCRRLGCPAVVITIRRIGKRHEIFVQPVSMHFTEDRKADVAKLTTALTRKLQNAIVSAPSQWVWLHQRWRQHMPSS